jgi:hypothetical protein
MVREERLLADIRTQFIGSIAKIDPINGFTGFDLSAFVQRLLLFERCTLESFGLQEIPVLVETFGYEPTTTLLKSKSINILFDMAAIIHWESDQTQLRRDTSGTVRVGPFIFGVGRLDRQVATNSRIQNLGGIPNLEQRQINKLREVLLSKLIGFENNTGNSAIAQFKTDLSNNMPCAALAVATVAGWITGRHIDPESFSLHITQTGPDSFEVLTNIQLTHGLNDQQTIHALSGGLIAVGQLNRDIEDMNQFQAMTAMRLEELPLLREKLTFLANQVNPDMQLERFQRVLEITGFPNLDESTSKSVDLEKLLEIKESRECREFRTWLWNAGSATDEEIRDQFAGLGNKLSLWAHGNVGKALRWAGSMGIGFIPIVGNLTSGALGLLDTFLLERVLPQSGPVIFLSRQYPSIFR